MLDKFNELYAKIISESTFDGTPVTEEELSDLRTEFNERRNEFRTFSEFMNSQDYFFSVKDGKWAKKDRSSDEDEESNWNLRADRMKNDDEREREEEREREREEEREREREEEDEKEDREA